jgi:hypothetical protein
VSQTKGSVSPTSQDSINLYSALLGVKAEIRTLPKDAVNPHFKSKYTPLDTIVEHVEPILTKHGLVWITKPCRDSTGSPALAYRLAHAESGQTEDGEMPLLLSKNDPQGQGSAITYARRYALCAVLNLVADVDDDGEATRTAAASRSPRSTEPKQEQATTKPEEKSADVKLVTSDGVTKLMTAFGQGTKLIEDIQLYLTAKGVEDTSAFEGDPSLDDLTAAFATLEYEVGRGLYAWLRKHAAQADDE